MSDRINYRPKSTFGIKTFFFYPRINICTLGEKGHSVPKIWPPVILGLRYPNFGCEMSAHT